MAGEAAPAAPAAAPGAGGGGILRALIVFAAVMYGREMWTRGKSAPEKAVSPPKVYDDLETSEFTTVGPKPMETARTVLVKLCTS